jgi:hypothetical protein
MTHYQTPSEKSHDAHAIAELSSSVSLLQCHSLFGLRVSRILNALRYFHATSRVKMELQLPEIMSITRVW